MARMSWLVARCMLAGAIVCCTVAARAGAQQRADWNHGVVLARTWCAACHAVDRYGAGSSFATPPPFSGIAHDPKMSPDVIRRQLSTSHTLMPKMALSERDKNDLIAYILTLRHSAD